MRKGDAGIIPGVATVSLVVLAAVGSVKADGNFIMEVPPADMTGLNVKVESVKGDGSTVVVSWNKSSDSTVVTNTVYYGPDSWHFTNSVSVAGIDTTNVTITGLASGVTYYFAGIASDCVGIGSMSYSQQTSYAIPPAAPTGLRIVGYNMKTRRGLEAAELLAVAGLSPSVWSILDPLLDSKGGAVEVASSQKIMLGL